MMRPLDIVKPVNGEPFVGLITELAEDGRVSVTWFDNENANRAGLYNAWWPANRLIVIDNLAAFLAKEIAHPFGGARKRNYETYSNKNSEND